MSQSSGCDVYEFVASPAMTKRKVKNKAQITLFSKPLGEEACLSPRTTYQEFERQRVAFWKRFLPFPLEMLKARVKEEWKKLYPSPPRRVIARRAAINAKKCKKIVFSETESEPENEVAKPRSHASSFKHSKFTTSTPIKKTPTKKRVSFVDEPTMIVESCDVSVEEVARETRNRFGETETETVKSTFKTTKTARFQPSTPIRKKSPQKMRVSFQEETNGIESDSHIDIQTTDSVEFPRNDLAAGDASSHVNFSSLSFGEESVPSAFVRTYSKRSLPKLTNNEESPKTKRAKGRFPSKKNRVVRSNVVACEVRTAERATVRSTPNRVMRSIVPIEAPWFQRQESTNDCLLPEFKKVVKSSCILAYPRKIRPSFFPDDTPLTSQPHQTPPKYPTK